MCPDVRPRVGPTYSFILYHTMHAVQTGIFVVFAVAFLNSVPTFERGGLVYSAMATTLSERDWGTLCAVMAGIGLATTFTTVWVARAAAAAILSVALIVLSFFFFRGNPYAPASYLFLLLAFQSAVLSYASAYLAARRAA